MGLRHTFGGVGASASVVLARHVETEKNLRDVHGTSELGRITEQGERQLARLAAMVRRDAPDLAAVVATPTVQAVETARRVAVALGLPYEGELALPAVDLGIAAGRSSAELRAVDREAHHRLDLFRTRIISGGELSLPGAETAAELENRLAAWWATEGRVRCPGRLVVGSSSTVLMITHLLNGILPTNPRYRYLATPNGSARRWRPSGAGWETTPSFPDYSWPDSEMLRIPSAAGAVAVTRHFPSWAPRRHTIVVIPGYFGSSRHGPYGLYTRLARAWAWQGFEVLTLDPLGSGDSTPVFRDFASEVRSVEIVAEWVLRQRPDSPLLLVGHSMGGATALRARDRAGRADWAVWCLAPLCRLADLARTFLGTTHLDQLQTRGRTYRHGLELRRDLIEDAGAAWDAHCKDADRVWVASADQYTRGMDLTPVPGDRLHRVEAADHNFSANESFPRLLASTAALLDVLEAPRLDRPA